MTTRVREVKGTHGVGVKSVDIMGNTKSKALYWRTPDAETRKRGNRTGLDTPVVHALNDPNWFWGVSTLSETKLTR